MDEDLHQLYVIGNNHYTLIEQSYCETSSLICRMPQSMATMKIDKLLAFLPHSDLCALGVVTKILASKILQFNAAFL